MSPCVVYKWCHQVSVGGVMCHQVSICSVICHQVSTGYVMCHQVSTTCVMYLIFTFYILFILLHQVSTTAGIIINMNLTAVLNDMLQLVTYCGTM